MAGRPIELPITADDVHHSHVRFVHQELALLPEATVLENLLITGYRGADYAHIGWGRERGRARELLDRFGLTDVALDAPTGRLTASDRAMIAIARAAGARGAEGGVLVVDEATAYLASDGAQRVLDAVVAARDHGVAVLMITHKLDEVFSLSNEVTVLRDGVAVLNEPTASLTRDDVVSAMLGTRSESAAFAEGGQRSVPEEASRSRGDGALDPAGPSAVDPGSGRGRSSGSPACEARASSVCPTRSSERPRLRARWRWAAAAGSTCSGSRHDRR